MKKSIFIGLAVVTCLVGSYWHSPGSANVDVTPGNDAWNPQVRETKGPLGHKSIAIDDTGGNNLVSFQTLKTWQFATDNPPEVPSPIKAIDGAKVSLAGFMFPLSEGEKIRTFCLMASTQTCCYGPKPEYNQFILVESPVEVSFERLRPVKVTGTFFVDPQPQEGFIFRMTAEKIMPAGEPNIQPIAIATGSILFPWEELEKLAPKSPSGLVAVRLSSPIQGLNQQEVIVGGYVLGGFQLKDSQGLLIGKYYWDGCCRGVPPHIFNSTLVILGSQTTNLGYWDQQATFTGILTLNPVEQWQTDGLVNIQNARLISKKG